MRPAARYSLSALAGLSLGFVLPAFLGKDWRRQQSGTPAGEAPGADSSSAAQSATLATDAKPGDSALVQALRKTLQDCPESERWSTWVKALEQAGPRDFPGLAKLADGIPRALELLAERWVERDAAGFFALCRDPGKAGPSFPLAELEPLLTQRWPERDPDAVAAVLEQMPGLRWSLHSGLLDRLSVKRPEQAVRLLGGMPTPGLGSGMLESVRKWAARDPRHAAGVIMANPNSFTDNLMEAVGKEWAKSDPGGALTYALSGSAYASTGLAKQVIWQWADSHPAEAGAWLTAAGEREKKLLLPTFMEAWAKTDPVEALRWSLENVAESERGKVVSALITGAASRNLAQTAELVSGLQDSAVRARAAAAFVSQTSESDGWWPGYGSTSGTPKPEALAWLDSLDGEARKAVTRQLAGSGWARTFPAKFAEFLLTPAAGEAEAGVLEGTAQALVKAGPERAIAWAERTPEALRGQVLAETFQTWSQLQPAASMDWLRALPAEDPRRADFYLGVVREIIPGTSYGLGSENDSPMGPLPEAPAKLAALLASDPAGAREAIERLHLTTEDRANVLSRLGLSSPVPGK